MSPQVHRVDKLRIALSLPSEDADRFSHRCSRLFHLELQRLIERVLTRLDTPGILHRVSKFLVIDLGTLPPWAFERTFCQRLESRLEQALRPLLSEASLVSSPSLGLSGTFDFQALFAQAEANVPASVSFDRWLLAQLEHVPDTSLALQICQCLSTLSGVQLLQIAQPSTIKQLCKRFAPNFFFAEDCRQETLLFSVLYYFYQNPHLSIPAHPRECRVSVNTLQDKQLLYALFDVGQFAVAQPSSKVKSWLQALWLHAEVRHTVLRDLTEEQGALLTTWMMQKSPVDIHEMSSTSVNPFESQPLHSRVIPDTEAEIYNKLAVINKAGLCLLWPFLPGLFRQLGLTEDNVFPSQQARHHAAACLEWLSKDLVDKAPDSTVPYLLCGLALDDTQNIVELEEPVQQTLSDWFLQLPSVLPLTWQKLSPEDIQQWFIQRTGWLTHEQGETVLYISTDTFDVLLNDWPWPINMIALPWLDRPIKVIWGVPA